jgi:four helix bundle protein
MKSYRDLEVYKESKRLAVDVHKMTMTLPKFEMFEEGSQVRRSSKAITSLIVEGYGRRRYKADFVKYLVHAQAECDETVVHLEFLFETRSLKDTIAYEHFSLGYDVLGKQINKFIQWVEKNLNDYTTSIPQTINNESSTSNP